MGVLLTFNYFIPYEVIKNRFTKASSILMEIVAIPVVMDDEFYFYFLFVFLYFFSVLFWASETTSETRHFV